MTQPLFEPRDTVEVYFHSQQPHAYVTDQDLEKYDAGRLTFPNTYFDPEKAQKIGRHLLWNQEHRQKGPREHTDPPGYQSGAARKVAAIRPSVAGGTKKLTYEDLQELNTLVLGNPETVTRKLKTTLECLSPGYLILIGGDGTVPHNDVMCSIELLGREVIPALHEFELQPYE